MRTMPGQRTLSLPTRIAAVLLSSLSIAACASSGATLNSGVGDRLLDHPPYYAGERLDTVARDTTRIGHLPISFQGGAAQPTIFDPRSGSGTPIDRLLGEMNAYLDSLGVSARLITGGPLSAVAHAARQSPPDVRFGCIPAAGIPDNDCAERDDSVLGRGGQTMQLSVGRPSVAWIQWNRELSAAAYTSRTLVITLEVGQYVMRQEGWRGNKVLEMGTGYNVQVPWLTSLEMPVSVLQLTGALMNRDGKAIRIGAEGLYARRTRLAVSAIGGQELLSDDDVEALRRARRNDMPQAPLVWRVALAELVSQLTGRGVATPK